MYSLVKLSQVLNAVVCGIPQGSVLGPLLFNIYINDITNATSKFNVIMYADDTTLVSTLENFGALNNIAVIEDEINREITKISHWLHSNKLLLNTAKSKFMVFFNSLESTGDNGRQPPLLPPRLRATRVDTIIHNYRLSAAP